MKNDGLYLPLSELEIGDTVNIDPYFLDSLFQPAPVTNREYVAFHEKTFHQEIKAVVVDKMMHDKHWRLILITESGELTYTKILNEKILLRVSSFVQRAYLLTNPKNLEPGDYIQPPHTYQFFPIVSIDQRGNYVSSNIGALSHLQIEYKIGYLDRSYAVNPMNSIYSTNSNSSTITTLTTSSCYYTNYTICNSFYVSEDQLVRVPSSAYDDLIPRSDEYSSLYTLLIKTSENFYGQVGIKDKCCYNIFKNCNAFAICKFRDKFFCGECMKKVAAIAVYLDTFTMRRYHIRKKKLSTIIESTFFSA